MNRWPSKGFCQYLINQHFAYYEIKWAKFEITFILGFADHKNAETAPLFRRHPSLFPLPEQLPECAASRDSAVPFVQTVPFANAKSEMHRFKKRLRTDANRAHENVQGKKGEVKKYNANIHQVHVLQRSYFVEEEGCFR